MAARMLLLGGGGGAVGGSGERGSWGVGWGCGRTLIDFTGSHLLWSPPSLLSLGRHAGRHQTHMLRDFIGTDGRNCRELDVNASPGRSKFAYYNYGR